MKTEQPFNPVPLPDGLKLSSEAGAVGPQETPPGSALAAPSAKGKRKPKTESPKSPRPKTSRPKKKRKPSWQELKQRFHHRLASLDKEKLKKVLIACGIAAGVVTAVLLAVKLLPIGVLLLAVMGLGAAFRFWERLRSIPRPLCA